MCIRDRVGTPAQFGQSSGCIRVLPDDSVKIWDWLSIDDEAVSYTHLTLPTSDLV